MKLPWMLKYLLRQLFGTLKGNAVAAWLEGPAGAAINAIYDNRTQQLLDSAERALIAEANKVEAELNLQRIALMKANQ